MDTDLNFQQPVPTEEQRKSPRISFRESVSFWQMKEPRNFGGCLSLDLSEGGLGLSSVKSKPPMEVMRIEFQLPGEDAPVRAAMQLAWTRPDGATFRIGLRFTALEENDRARIRRYVDARTNIAAS